MNDKILATVKEMEALELELDKLESELEGCRKELAGIKQREATLDNAVGELQSQIKYKYDLLRKTFVTEDKRNV